MRLYALVSGLALLGATPCLALTISSAPPSRDAAQHLKPSENSGPRLQDTFVGSGRPALGPSYGRGFSGGSSVHSTSYGFGSVQTTTSNDPREPRWLNERRETPAPLGLSPRR